MKNEWKWWAGFGLINVFIVGVISEFRFDAVAIRMHDTYFSIHAVRAIFYLTALLVIIRNLYSLVDLLTSRYKIMALLISIINPIVTLFTIIILYLDIQGMAAFREIRPGTNLSAQLIVPIILAGVIGFEILIEFITLRKAWRLLKKSYEDQTSQ